MKLHGATEQILHLRGGAAADHRQPPLQAIEERPHQRVQAPIHRHGVRPLGDLHQGAVEVEEEGRALQQVKRWFGQEATAAEELAEGGEPVATPPGDADRETSTNAQTQGSVGQPWGDEDELRS